MLRAYASDAREPNHIFARELLVRVIDFSLRLDGRDLTLS
jgi:hypothetical protein